MESVSRNAIELADEAVEFAGELNVGAFDLENGATVIDFGVDHRGGVEAGLLLAELQTAGLATVQTRMGEVAGAPFQFVELSCDRPAISLLCSQKAGWEVTVDGFEALGSGPARALVADEPEFRELGYTDAFDLTVLTLETDGLPSERVAAEIAERAGTATDGLYLPVYRTASVAGSVSMAARPAELAAFRLFELGYDPADILGASGSAPVAPVAASEEEAIARTNDALAFGGQVTLRVREDFDAFDEIPSNAFEEYGAPFAEIFAETEWEFADVDPRAFAPAQVTVDVVGGPTYAVGETHEELLLDSFDLRE
ncbi:methenyltetrahydromethanopterin cyclohydrolase [Halocalculus aciditolerans]|nr:methenyltetrahydromethanopterin cyclohydrolase [Halocalculus aciditolerans]